MKINSIINIPPLEASKYEIDISYLVHFFLSTFWLRSALIFHSCHLEPCINIPVLTYLH
jgi:hypothetical protein